jgi:ergothioneine biosynthesis protein EgtB
VKPTPTAAESSSTLLRRYRGIRQRTLDLCATLETEDYVVQSMPDASPVRWHLAHTTWFFETFVLARAEPDHRPFHPAFRDLFNSYYNRVGEPFPRAQRGTLSRPTVREVLAYRAHVDARMEELLAAGVGAEVAARVELGHNHEEQHQELILTDVKHAFAANPVRPALRERPADRVREAVPAAWVEFGEGVREIGHDGPGFAFDNERPRHRVFTAAFALASRAATSGEFARFIADRGYERPELWLSDGWNVVQHRGWRAPLYWEERGGAWWTYTLAGDRLVAMDEPVCHVSYFEADAFARWAGARLPTEAEWEVAAAEQPAAGHFLDPDRLHPAPATAGPGLRQMLGDVWEWTQSQYVAYPGYRPWEGEVGEYNGKFMCNQFVLRGGSCATPAGHVRATYRNFFPPDARWQFAGVRLARG